VANRATSAPATDGANSVSHIRKQVNIGEKVIIALNVNTDKEPMSSGLDERLLRRRTEQTYRLLRRYEGRSVAYVLVVPIIELLVGAE